MGQESSVMTGRAGLISDQLPTAGQCCIFYHGKSLTKYDSLNFSYKYKQVSCWLWLVDCVVDGQKYETKKLLCFVIEHETSQIKHLNALSTAQTNIFSECSVWKEKKLKSYPNRYNFHFITTFLIKKILTAIRGKL